MKCRLLKIVFVAKDFEDEEKSLAGIYTLVCGGLVVVPSIFKMFAFKLSKEEGSNLEVEVKLGKEQLEDILDGVTSCNRSKLSRISSTG